MTPVIVCGNAWTLHDDLERARHHFPNAPIIAVNGASGEVKACALFSQHPRKFPRWIEWQRTRFGEGFTVHAAGKQDKKTKLGVNLRHPYVDQWWPNAASGGTSAWGARRMAKFMGYDTVIFCGVPLQPGGYANNEPPRIMRDQKLMDHYRYMIKKDTEFHSGVFSMSGWTKEFFGGLD